MALYLLLKGGHIFTKWRKLITFWALLNLSVTIMWLLSIFSWKMFYKIEGIFITIRPYSIDFYWHPILLVGFSHKNVKLNSKNSTPCQDCECIVKTFHLCIIFAKITKLLWPFLVACLDNVVQIYAVTATSHGCKKLQTTELIYFLAFQICIQRYSNTTNIIKDTFMRYHWTHNSVSWIESESQI